MLELWKPLKVKKDRVDQQVIFDPLGYTYRNSFRPFIIFYDDKEDCYYYLKARGAFKNDGVSYRNAITYVDTIEERPIIVEELVKPVVPNSYFYKDSYVDCSQIFKCDRQLLESLVDLDSEMINAKPISIKAQEKIKNKIRDLCMEVPPFLSIAEIKLDENNKTYLENIYINKSIFWSVNYDKDGEQLEDESDFFSVNDENNENYQRRFNKGIDFCLMFLNEYFPDEINEFAQLQGIELESETDDEEYEYDPFVEISAKIYLKFNKYTFYTSEGFEKFISDLDSEQLESIRFDDWSDEDLYNDCSELLDKLKEDIKAKDRGGDGGMSM